MTLRLAVVLVCQTVSSIRRLVETVLYLEQSPAHSRCSTNRCGMNGWQATDPTVEEKHAP